MAHARLADDGLVAGFYPSLYVNLGRAYELTGDAAQAAHYYGVAARLGLVHRSE